MADAEVTDALETKIAELELHKDRDWARFNFKNTVHALIETTRAKEVLEIGGGRAPLFTQGEVESLGIRYVTSDILQSELDRAPEWADKFVFDITTTDPAALDAHRGRYDLAFSKWVMEHVSDYRRAYANIHAVLAPGGVHIAFHPLRFALPFLLNTMLPEPLSRPLLIHFLPNRDDEGSPKFPAHYSGCRISASVREQIRQIGFRDVWQLPFYGHGYYQPFPVLRDLHAAATRALRDADVSLLAAFCFTIVRKQ
jgi:SAM-dependent methyltransferase